MVTFLLVNKERAISSIAMLISFKGIKYKRSTGESVPVKMWNNTKKRAKVTSGFEYGNAINDILGKLESAALVTLSQFKMHINPPSKDAFFSAFDNNYYVEARVPHEKPSDFYDIFDNFLANRKLSDVRVRQYKVLYRALKRYELYSVSKLTFKSITSDTLRDFEKFLEQEHTFITVSKDGNVVCSPKYQRVYNVIPESRMAKARGGNTLSMIFNLLRTLFNYALNNGVIASTPFKNFEIKVESYGTPYYITIDERNQIYRHDFTMLPQLAIQRDIFVFQCVIGCRVSDLYAMTRANIINGAIEYIARKTKEGRPVTVRVPLNSIAKDILEQYKDIDSVPLFPFIAQQNYNDAIKQVFLLSGVTRMVTIVNSVTSEQEQRPMNEIASSHLARRCFIGNLYKQVKDPNLVGALSGHKEGSKAFARYREIDEQMKQDLVQLLE